MGDIANLSDNNLKEIKEIRFMKSYTNYLDNAVE